MMFIITLNMVLNHRCNHDELEHRVKHTITHRS